MAETPPLKTLWEKPKGKPQRFVTHEEIVPLIRRAIAEIILGHPIRSEAVLVEQEMEVARAHERPASPGSIADVAAKRGYNRLCGLCRQPGHKRQTCPTRKP